MKLATYVIAQGDSLGILAQQLSTDEDTLIEINRLRYPYISDNPADQYARPKGNVFLTAPANDASNLSIGNPNGIVILQNDVIFAIQGMTFAAAIVQSYSGTVVSFASPLSGSFDQSALITVFPNQQNIATQVLRTGDTLLYPMNSIWQSAIVAKPYSLAWGTDWALDENGFLKKSNGDIATVSGVDNLNQAQKMRQQTPLGGLPLHQDYGNELFSIIGEASQPHFKSLAAFYIEECSKQDIRISDAKVSDLSVSNDRIVGDLTYTPVGSQEVVNQPISIPIGGIG